MLSADPFLPPLVATIAVLTTLHADPETVFDVLLDFEGYPTYTEYLTDARAIQPSGNGTEGTVYGMDFSWWKLDYTARSQVTDVERPNHVRWELVGGPAARGVWRVDETEAPSGTNSHGASDVTFAVQYDPNSISGSDLGHPLFVPIDWVVEQVTPLVQAEAVQVIERVAEDVEDGGESGERRDVDVRIESGPDAAEHLPEDS